MIVSNFDISALDVKLTENMDFSIFTRIYFPRISYDDIETIIDDNLEGDIGNLEKNYKLSKLDKIYKTCLPSLGYHFHNLNDILFHMKNNVEFASLNYISNEKNFNILQLAKESNFRKENLKETNKM